MSIKKPITFLLATMLLVTKVDAAEPHPSIVVSVDHPTLSATQAQEIGAILRELEYLREVAATLAKKHAGDPSKIRFNYTALIRQLEATENGIRAYLNAQIDAIHVDPPSPVNTPLFQVRQN